MSLTKCAVTNPIDTADRRSIDKAILQHLKEGMDIETASKQAVDALITQLRADKSKLVGESAAYAAKPSGLLTALAVKSPDGTPYNLRNLLADFFTQSSGSDVAATVRPLVAVADFMRQLSEQTTKISDFLENKEASDKQRALLKVFRSKFNEWSPIIKGNLVKGYWNNTSKLAKENPDFAYTDLMQFLIQGDNETGLDIEENVKTAIVYGALRAVLDSASKGQFASEENINLAMGRQDDADVSEDELDILSNVGTRENSWRNSVGKVAVASLGLKPIQDAPGDLLPRLETAFGAHIEKLLMDVGLLERNTLRMEDMETLFPFDEWQKAQELLPQDKRQKEQKLVPWKFLSLPMDKAGKFLPEVLQIIEASKETKGILDKLFSVEANIQYPSLTPPPMTQKTIKGTSSGIPSNIAAAVAEQHSEENLIREDSWRVYNTLSPEAYLAIHGFVNPETTIIHEANKIGVNSKNAGLVREYDRLGEFVNEILLPVSKELSGVPFFLASSVKRQQRVNIATNGFNPQGSKMHRNAYYKPSWKTEIALDDTTQLNNFFLRVAEGLGVKTDSQVDLVTLEGFTLLFDPSRTSTPEAKQKAVELLAAVRVLQNILYNTSAVITTEEEQALILGGKTGGEKGHSLAALTDMAHYFHAKETDQKTFISHIQGEVDGKTNGIILSQLLFGGATSVDDMKTRMRRGGFFFKEDGHTQFSSWKSVAGNLDQYESLTRRIVDLARKTMYKNPLVFAAIEAFTKPLVDKAGKVVKAGRDLTKNPLTTMMYGSKTYSAVDKMADKVIATVYANIEAVAKGESSQTLEQVLTNLNTLIVAGGEVPVNIDMSIEEALGSKLGKQQVKAIKKAFHRTLGSSAKQAIEEDFSDYLRVRETVIEVSQLVFDMSNAIITDARATFIQELAAAGTLDVKDGVQLQALSRKQEKEFQKRVAKLAPMIHTVGSRRDNKISNGVLMATSKNTLSTNPAFQSKNRFGKPFADTIGRRDKNGKSIEAFSVMTNSDERVQSRPGVGVISMMVQSLDSSISSDSQLDRHTQNNHDALNDGLNDLHGTAEALNKNTWRNLSEYSPLSELLSSLTGMLQSITEISVDAKNQRLTDGALTNLAKVLNEAAKPYNLSPEGHLTDLIKRLSEYAYTANTMKFAVLAEVVAVDQYTLEGGNFLPTDADRQAMVDAKEVLSPEVPLEVFEAVDTLMAQMKDKLTVPKKWDQKVKGKTIWGDIAIGTPSIRSDEDLVGVFETRGSLTTKQVVHVLRKKFPTNTVSREILDKIAPLLGDGLKVQYIRPDTQESAVLAMPTEPSRGWYVADKEGNEVIYVLSPEFVDSGLTPELLLHELLHAALAQTLRNPSVAATALVQELEALLAEAKTIVEGDPALSQYAAAVSSVDELVSWGMTNQDFQAKVLSKVKMVSKTKDNILITGMKAFIESVSKLLFRNPTKKQNHGVSILISNVSGLIASTTAKDTTTAVNQSMATNAANPSNYTTIDIFAALNDGRVPSDFQEHLGNLLNGIVESLHGSFGAFKESFMSNQAGTALEVWAKAKVTGIAPFASQALMSGFPASQQEAFAMEQVEATVAAALSSRDSTTKGAYKELYELYSEAYKTFKPSDFASQADYDFVFKIEQGNGGVSNYLSRFAALGLANQKFNSMLKIASDTSPRQVKASKSFPERLQLLFQKILAMFNRKVLHVYAGQDMDEKLGFLVEQLVDIEAKRKASIGEVTWDVQLMNPMAKTAHQITEAAKAGIAKLGGSPLMQSGKIQTVKAVGNLAKILTTKGRTKSFLLAFRDMRDKYTDERMGLVSSLMQEYIGQDDKNQVLLRGSKLNDGHRKDAISGFSKSVKEGFKDNGKAMTEESRNSITPVFLRTGAHHLVGQFSLVEMEAMLQNPADLQAAITKVENQLVSVPLAIRADYIEKANALGMFKATGKVLDPHLLKNAYSIAKMYGTASQAKISNQQAEQAQPVIAALVALYALEYTNETQLKHAHEALQTENQRTDGQNGVEFVLAIHKDMEKESLERLFKGNPALMTHGYTPEIYDPFVTITTANAIDGAKLEAQGYKKGAALSVDPADPDTSQRSLYVLQGLGMTRRLTGAMAYEGKAAKGSKVHSGYTNTRTTSGTNNANTNAGIAAHRAKLGNRSPTRSRVDLSKAKDISYMAPVLDDDGNVTTWAYLAQETTKDSLLRRDNRFDKVIGTLAGSILGKESGVEQNDKVIVALKEQFDLDTKKSLDSYFLVGPKTNDPERQEIWNLLPYETKQIILKVWGEDGMLVRKDAMDIMFGYRKLSLTDAFNKDPVLRDAFERVVVAIARAVFGEKAALRLAQGERGWQDIVAEAKDLIVVKTGVVMLSNIKSNMWLLAMSGVPIKDILYHHLVALKGSHSYRKDSEELAELQRLLATGYTQGKDVQIARDIARLEDALARNPVKELMDAGLMPTIVDGINPDDDIYSYKSGLAKAIDSKLKKVSPLVINAAKTIYMAHDTKLYQGVHRITQLSDFVARYTMYQHLTNQKTKPLTKEEAIQEASDAFINYDIPMHRKMQYLDDMGIMMFTKYLLRIQKVLVKNLRDNPGRVIGSILLANYLGLGETVHQEASMWGRIGNNPFGVGAGNYFSSLDDLATISGPMALIK